MADIFISYAREDLERARQLAVALEAQGWSVFWDRTIPPGKTWRDFVGKALEDARCVLVAWSAASIDSHWVQEEADDGRQRDILVPVLFENVRPPIGFRSIQAADLIRWDGTDTDPAFQTFVANIVGTLGPSPTMEERRRAETEAKRKAEEEDKKRQAEAEERRREKEAEKRRGQARAATAGYPGKGTLQSLPKRALWIAGGAVVVTGVLVWAPWKGDSAPPTIQLGADPAAIESGDSATLSWNAEDADEVRLEPGGTVEARGSLKVSPQSDIWYKLTARGAGGTAEDSVSVTVTSPSPAAELVEDITIPPTTFEENPIAKLPPPSDTSRLGDKPVFTPLTVRPRIKDRNRALQIVDSAYPKPLIDAGIGGEVRVWVLIDTNGRVQNAHVEKTSGNESLDEAALQAAKQFEFTPALNRDEKVPAWVAIPITFRVQEHVDTASVP